MVVQILLNHLGVLGVVLTSRVARVCSIFLLFLFPKYPDLQTYGFYPVFVILFLGIIEVVLESKDDEQLNQYLHKDDMSLNNTNQLLNALNSSISDSSTATSSHVKDLKKKDLIAHITTTWELDESVAVEIEILVDLVLRDFIVFWFTTSKFYLIYFQSCSCICIA